MEATSRLIGEGNLDIMKMVVLAGLRLVSVISWGKIPNLEVKFGAKYQICSLICHLGSPKWHQVRLPRKLIPIILFFEGRGHLKNMKQMSMKRRMFKLNCLIIFCENLKKVKKTQFTTKNPLAILTARWKCEISIWKLFGYSSKEFACQRSFRAWWFGFW